MFFSGVIGCLLCPGDTCAMKRIFSIFDIPNVILVVFFGVRGIYLSHDGAKRFIAGKFGLLFFNISFSSSVSMSYLISS
jgi:hypothetical protein